MELTPFSFDEADKISRTFIASGFFKDIKQASQGIVKIMAGNEIGIPPFAAMRGINIIEGHPELSANILATKIKNSGKYDYRVEDWDENGCTVVVFQDKEEIGRVTFDKDDAQRANLLNKNNWRNHPKSMYFARAISIAARTFCPDAFNGVSVYVTGEISDAAAEEAEVLTPGSTKKVVEEVITNITDEELDGLTFDSEGAE